MGTITQTEIRTQHTPQEAELGVLQPVDALAADTDIVRGTHDAEVGAERGQLPDQLAESPVMRFSPGQVSREGRVRVREVVGSAFG